MKISLTWKTPVRITTMGDTLWRQCAQWICALGVLPINHRIVSPEADATILAYTLRDGVVLCNIANVLSPGCIDTKWAIVLSFFKNVPFPTTVFFIFVFSIVVSSNAWSVDDCIWTTDIWYPKRPLCHLSINHFVISSAFQSLTLCSGYSIHFCPRSMVKQNL